MTNFPDTVFNVAGIVPVAIANQRERPRAEFRTNIVVLESMENERRYFTQHVIDDRIAAFERYQSDFEGTGEFRDRQVRIDHHALYCFDTPSGRFLGTRAEIAPKIAQQLAQGIYRGEDKVEAALVAGDKIALQNALDDRFDELASGNPVSADFFRHNNILRPLIESDLQNRRLVHIVRNLKIEAKKQSVRLRFPAGVRQEEALAISSSARRQMRQSRAFDTLELDESDMEPLSRMSVADYRSYVRLDLNYSSSFIESVLGKALFVPAGGWRDEIFRDMYDPEGQDEMVAGYKAALESILSLKAVNLSQALTLASLCMFTARTRGHERWWDFGGIRCCVLAIRKDILKLLGDDEPLQKELQANDLFCANAALRLFERSVFRKNATFDSFVKKELVGVVNKRNFTDFEFGVDKYLDFMITSALGL